MNTKLKEKGAKTKSIFILESVHYFPENYNSLILETVDFV